mmetsp:Transcript_18773/g.56916  ORF Transcript_18773/g.56916 Transcript_18773/m.56916 type:complete len:329 (-) Transcript_18773:60-1046(-)
MRLAAVRGGRSRQRAHAERRFADAGRRAGRAPSRRDAALLVRRRTRARLPRRHWHRRAAVGGGDARTRLGQPGAAPVDRSLVPLPPAAPRARPHAAARHWAAPGRLLAARAPRAGGAGGGVDGGARLARGRRLARCDVPVARRTRTRARARPARPRRQDHPARGGAVVARHAPPLGREAARARRAAVLGRLPAGGPPRRRRPPAGPAGRLSRRVARVRDAARGELVELPGVRAGTRRRRAAPQAPLVNAALHVAPRPPPLARVSPAAPRPPRGSAVRRLRPSRPGVRRAPTPLPPPTRCAGRAFSTCRGGVGQCHLPPLSNKVFSRVN